MVLVSKISYIVIYTLVTMKFLKNPNRLIFTSAGIFRLWSRYASRSYMMPSSSPGVSSFSRAALRLRKVNKDACFYMHSPLFTVRACVRACVCTCARRDLSSVIGPRSFPVSEASFALRSPSLLIYLQSQQSLPRSPGCVLPYPQHKLIIFICAPLAPYTTGHISQSFHRLE